MKRPKNGSKSPASSTEPGRYRPMMSAERARRLRQWHLETDRQLRRGLPRRIFYLGLELRVPTDVFPPLTRGHFYPAIEEEVKASDRVLDMGTGCGIAAILAARRATNVVAVDINPKAVEAAVENAARNGAADRITVKQSDVFDSVDGQFDLIVFHPPYRWFRPRDLLEASTTDEDYRVLRRFMQQAPERLHAGGRMLLYFGSSGDVDYLNHLIEKAGFAREVLSAEEVATETLTLTYYVLRLRR